MTSQLTTARIRLICWIFKSWLEMDYMRGKRYIHSRSRDLQGRINHTFMKKKKILAWRRKEAKTATNV